MPSTTTAPENRLAGTLLFGATIFLSAFLIFLVQPMVGKRIVPWFGGTPGVWTLCLAFYQSALFLGYAYAHLLVARISPRLQLALHAALFAQSANFGQRGDGACFVIGQHDRDQNRVVSQGFA